MENRIRAVDSEEQKNKVNDKYMMDTTHRQIRDAKKEAEMKRKET